MGAFITSSLIGREGLRLPEPSAALGKHQAPFSGDGARWSAFFSHIPTGPVGESQPCSRILSYTEDLKDVCCLGLHAMNRKRWATAITSWDNACPHTCCAGTDFSCEVTVPICMWERLIHNLLLSWAMNFASDKLERFYLASCSPEWYSCYAPSADESCTTIQGCISLWSFLTNFSSNIATSLLWPIFRQARLP